MRDIDLFSKLLCLERPWKVTRVSLAAEEKHIDVWLDHSRSASFCCPDCRMPSSLYDHIPLRKWRHLDHGGFLTWLNARVPRVACREHGIRQGRETGTQLVCLGRSSFPTQCVFQCQPSRRAIGPTVVAEGTASRDALMQMLQFPGDQRCVDALDPVGGTFDGPVGEDFSCWVRGPGTSAEAAAGTLLGTLDKSGA